jgi:hypothetical protein
MTRVSWYIQSQRLSKLDPICYVTEVECIFSLFGGNWGTQKIDRDSSSPFNRFDVTDQHSTSFCCTSNQKVNNIDPICYVTEVECIFSLFGGHDFSKNWATQPKSFLCSRPDNFFNIELQSNSSSGHFYFVGVLL